MSTASLAPGLGVAVPAPGGSSMSRAALSSSWLTKSVSSVGSGIWNYAKNNPGSLAVDAVMLAASFVVPGSGILAGLGIRLAGRLGIAAVTRMTGRTVTRTAIRLLGRKGLTQARTFGGRALRVVPNFVTGTLKSSAKMIGAVAAGIANLVNKIGGTAISQAGGMAEITSGGVGQQRQGAEQDVMQDPSQGPDPFDPTGAMEQAGAAKQQAQPEAGPPSQQAAPSTPVER